CATKEQSKMQFSTIAITLLASLTSVFAVAVPGGSYYNAAATTSTSCNDGYLTAVPTGAGRAAVVMRPAGLMC
ncbi:hypothetical protein HDU97_007554, partial [Phlyctochytrium planicorne]